MAELKGEQFWVANLSRKLKGKLSEGKKLWFSASGKQFREKARLSTTYSWTVLKNKIWVRAVKNGEAVGSTCNNVHTWTHLCVVQATSWRAYRNYKKYNEINLRPADYWYTKSRPEHHPRNAGLTKGQKEEWRVAEERIRITRLGEKNDARGQQNRQPAQGRKK